MKNITKTILAVLATGVISCAFFSQQAQANTISIEDPPTVVAGTWNYGASTSNSFLDGTARVVIYDFAGFTGVPGVNAPAGWTFIGWIAGNAGTPIPLSGDNPTINNLVWAYIGAPGSVPDMPNGTYGNFSANSSISLQVLGGYGTLDKGQGAGNPVSGGFGPTRVPSAPDSGTTVGLLGLALAGIEGVRRMIHARKA